MSAHPDVRTVEPSHDPAASAARPQGAGRSRRNAAASLGVTAALAAVALAPAASVTAPVALAAVDPDTPATTPDAELYRGPLAPEIPIVTSDIEDQAAAKEAVDRAVNRSSRSSARQAPDSEAADPKVGREEADSPASASSDRGDSGGSAERDSAEAVGVRYTTAGLNVRTAPDADADLVAVLDEGARVRITSRSQGDWQQILRGDALQWVRADYLSRTQPKAEPAQRSSGISSAPCASGSSVEGPLTSNAIQVHRAVCARFPQVTSYGGWRAGGGNHGSGRALDIMVTGSVGDQIASFVRANASKLGVSEVIWSQRIWTVQRSGEGWRGMSDRGSVTDNHYDHVHVSVY